MAHPATAEAIDFYPENEVIRQRPDRLIGHVAIEAAQAEYDAITELSELVDGQMRVPIQLTFEGNDLYGPDGRSLTETAKNGLKAAQEAAKKNGNLWFEVGRRSLELEEVQMMVETVKTKSANTMVVTTDFPLALKDAKEGIGGYNVIRQQALARVLVVYDDDKIILWSQTLDGSNRLGLEAIHKDFGFEAEDGELLGQRRLLNLTAEERAVIMDRITSVYDHKMVAQFGGEWYAGRQPVDYRNTYDFVCQQHDLIDVYKKHWVTGTLTDKTMYNLAATINARFEKSRFRAKEKAAITQPLSILHTTVRPLDFVDPALLYRELKLEGDMARSEGKSFSACCSTFKANDLDESTENLLGRMGYGNKAEISKSWHGGKRYKNSKCVSCLQVKPEVGACYICEDCVKNPKKHGLGTVQGRTGDPKKAKINKEPAQVFSLNEFRNNKEKAKRGAR